MDSKFELIKWHLENSTIDDQEFERVAAEMQDGNGWNSFWIAGGGDYGEDGVLIDKNAQSIPLITTTSDRALENIKRNLAKLMETGWAGKRIAFATPRQLTTAKRQNIKKHLDNLKIQSVGMFDSVWYAERLLKYPHFCKSLLGITLDFPALSPLPVNPRFSAVPGTIGREEEKKRVFELFQEKKDFLVSGQPGSGKTHLLRELAKIGEAYFVVSSNLDSIANEIRLMNPKYLLIDDAHSRWELVEKLLLFRKNIKADFALGIDSWPSHRDEIVQTLLLGQDQIIDLGPLKRDEIVSLIKAEGVKAHTWVIRNIVDQSRGKPGLASFLCQQFKKGAANDVVFGHALLVKLIADSRGVEGIIPLLSVISLGGERGVDIEKVGQLLGKSPYDLINLLSNLVTAGVIEETKGKLISVQPNLLRYNLIKEKFFNTAPLLNKKLLLEVCDDFEISVYEIIQAVRVGAKISANDLYEIVKISNKDDTWKAFAWLGKEFVQLLIHERPELILVFGEAGLVHAPEISLMMLFSEAAKHEYSSHNTHRSYKIIGDWLTELPEFSKQDVVDRREIFLAKAKAWLEKGGDKTVIENLAPNVLSIYWDSTEQDPGKGNTFMLTNGIMPLGVINRIPIFWKGLLDLYQNGLLQNPTFLLNGLTELYSKGGMIQISEDLKETIRGHRNKCLQTLATAVSTYNDEGFKRRLINKLDKAKISHGLKLSEDFEVLYPNDDLEEDYKVAEYKAKLEVNNLVEKWAAMKPNVAAARFSEIVESAKRANLNWPDRSTYFSYELAKAVSNPLEWALCLKAEGISSRYLDSFFGRIVEEKKKGWDDFCKECLSKESPYRSSVISKLVLSLDIPQDLWELLMAGLSLEDSNWLSHAFSYVDVPEANAEKILLHPSPEVRGAFAFSLWNRKEKAPKLQSLRHLWENAILEYIGDRHTMKEILKRDPKLTAKWILRNIKGDWVKFEIQDIIKSSVKNFDSHTRMQILTQVPFIVKNKEVIKNLVGRDLSLYKILIDSEAEDYVKVSPLEGYLSKEWEEMAKLALDSGISEDLIYDGTMLKGYGFSGSAVDYWEQRNNNYKMFVGSDDERIARIARELSEYAERNIEDSKERLKEEEIYGRF